MNRNFRFPAFSDETGVKLPISKEQENFLAKDLPAITKKEILHPNPQEKETPEKIGAKVAETRWNPERKNSAIQKRTYFHASKKTVFSGEKISRKTSTSLPTKRSFPIVKNEKPIGGKEEHMGNPSSEKPASNPLKKEVEKKKYFVPKYIPASLIEEEKAPVISNEELVQSLKKPKESYLLFGKNQLTPEDNADDIIPETLKKEEKKANPSKKEGKKKGVLEKSLKGIFEEQTPFHNRYFEV